MRNASFIWTLYGCVVSVCCIGFAPLGVVCDELHDFAGMLVVNSFLISVDMFIVSKALLISRATVIVRNCRVLCFVPVFHGCVWNVYCSTALFLPLCLIACFIIVKRFTIAVLIVKLCDIFFWWGGGGGYTLSTMSCFRCLL